jgi:hypothetical protein
VLLVIVLVSALADSPTPTAAQAYLDDATATQQAVTLSVVSEDPYANPDTYHQTQVEPETSSFGSTIVSAFQTGRSLEWGASNLGWSVSTDAGATWTDGFLPGTTVHATPPGRWERVVDPSVAYDAKHDHWLIEGLGTRNLTGQRDRLFVSVSTDGAQTLGEPIIVARADRFQVFDKNWITYDNTPTSPFYGNCYTAWDNRLRRRTQPPPLACGNVGGRRPDMDGGHHAEAFACLRLRGATRRSA